MSDLICVRSFENAMEAELAKNFLDSSGIPAMLSSEGKGEIKLMVRSQDSAQAESLLNDEGHDTETLDTKTREAFQQEEHDRKEAAREFSEIKIEELRQKAQSAKSNAVMGWFLLAAGIIILFFSHGQNFLMKAGMACIVFAVIQYFVWKDCKQAAKELEKDE